MNENRIQIWCNTDKEYEAAMAIQEQNNRLDPNHVVLSRVIVVDCRTKY